MHKSSIEKMRYFKDKFLSGRTRDRLKIYDLGSAAIGGSYRSIFNEPNWDYIGVDLLRGENVNLVLSDPYIWLEIDSDSVDVVISGQAFEHIEYFWKTILEIARILKPGGLCCIIAPSSGPEHKYPVDCWRFYPDGFRALARYAGLELRETWTEWDPKNYGDGSELWKDTFFVGQKTASKKESSQEGPHIYRRDIRCGEEDSLSKIIRHLAPKSYVLELGPATGYLTRFLKENLGCRVDCVEVCPEMAEEAKKYSDRMLIADLEKVSLEEEFGTKVFDFVILADVLEHVREDKRLLTSCAKVLKESGKCLVSVPNIAHASIFGELFAGRFEYSDEGLLDKTHVRFYTRRSIQRKLIEAGFDIRQIEAVIRLPEETEFRNSLSSLPIEVQRAILDLEDSLTYQFIIECTPRKGGPCKGNFGPLYSYSAVDLRRAVLKGYEDRISALENAYEQARDLAYERLEYINKLEPALEEAKQMAFSRLDRITEMERVLETLRMRLHVYEEDPVIRRYWKVRKWVKKNFRR